VCGTLYFYSVAVYMLLSLQLPVVTNGATADPYPIAFSISLSFVPLRLWPTITTVKK